MTRYRLDSQFHCSYLDSRGVPGKTREKKRGKLSPFHFRFTTSGDVISGDATSGRACAHDHFRHHLTAPPQIRFELSPYTTYIFTVPSSLIHRNSICILFWQLVYLDYGMGAENPIDSVRFYKKNDVTKAIKLNRKDVCIILRICVTWPVIIIHAFKKSYPHFKG